MVVYSQSWAFKLRCDFSGSWKGVNEIEQINSISDFKEKIEIYLGGRITDLLEIILGGAIKLNVSDIHIEPEKEKAKMRIRIDGILQNVFFLNIKEYNSLISRIKLLIPLSAGLSFLYQ